MVRHNPPNVVLSSLANDVTILCNKRTHLVVAMLLEPHLFIYLSIRECGMRRNLTPSLVPLDSVSSYHSSSLMTNRIVMFAFSRIVV